MVDAVVNEGPIVVRGGASFDDMDNIGVKEETPKTVDEPTTEAIPEVVKDEEKKDEEPKKEEPKKADPKKKIKGKLGDSELEFDLDTMVPVIIDGKEEMVPLSEIRNGYSGTKAVAKRFSEIDAQKKAFIKEKQELENKYKPIETNLNTLKQKLESESPYEAVEYLLENMGKDAYDFKYNKLLPSMMDEVTQLLQMDEVAREAYLLKKENEYIKKGLESKANQSKEEASRMELLTKVDKMREAHGLTEEDFVNAHEELASRGVKGLDPEKVVGFASNLKLVTKAHDWIAEIDPTKSESDDVIRGVADVIRSNPDVTKEQLQAELKRYWGLPEKMPEALAEKVKEAEQVGNNPSQKKNFVKGFESFDDYEK